MTRRLLLFVFATLAFFAAPLGAHEGHEHKIMGTVTMVVSDHVMVKDKAGKEFTVYTTDATKVMKDKKPATVRDVMAGMRVVVTAITEKKDNVERMRAKQIDLGAMSAHK